MAKVKRYFKCFLFPHPVIMVLLIPVSVALLVYSFVFLDTQEIISYVSYVLSAYMLTVFCIRIPQVIAVFRGFKQENPYLKRYLSDTALRVNISLYGSLMLNTAYAVFQLGLGVYHHTVWYYSFAGYYMILAVMRFFLLKHTRSHKVNEERGLELLIYRFCGMLLVIMNMALSAIVFYIVVQGRTFVHHEITTIAMAAYTFTSLTLAVLNVIKYRKYNSPVYSASKVINFTTALVSIITLESTMLTTFGEAGQKSFRLMMTALTGLGITVTILAIAIYMIVTSTKEIRALKKI